MSLYINITLSSVVCIHVYYNAYIVSPRVYIVELSAICEAFLKMSSSYMDIVRGGNGFDADKVVPFSHPFHICKKNTHTNMNVVEYECG